MFPVLDGEWSKAQGVKMINFTPDVCEALDYKGL